MRKDERNKVTSMQLLEDTWVLVNSNKKCGESMNEVVNRVFNEWKTLKGDA